MANKKFTTLEADPTTVITTPAPGDFILIHDISEPLLAKQIKAIAYADLVKLVTQSALQALVTGQAAGDTFYADTTTALARLAKPSVDSVLKNTSAGVPSFMALTELLRITNRQGGSATIWKTYGTTNYVPVNQIVQCGVARITIVSAFYGNITVTFPQAFAYAPLIIIGSAVLVSGSWGGLTGLVYGANLSTTQVGITVNQSGQDTTTWDVPWLAIGPI
jgi:hypothetical protein